MLSFSKSDLRCFSYLDSFSSCLLGLFFNSRLVCRDVRLLRILLSYNHFVWDFSLHAVLVLLSLGNSWVFLFSFFSLNFYSEEDGDRLF